MDALPHVHLIVDHPLTAGNCLISGASSVAPILPASWASSSRSPPHSRVNRITLLVI